MNGLISAEEADQLKQVKEKEIFRNVVVERVENPQEDQPANVPTPALLRISETYPNLYE
jgi:hypothetical protein